MNDNDIFLCIYLPYSDTIQFVRKVRRETACYYFVRLNETTELQINKRTLREKGCTRQWYRKTKEELDIYYERQKLIRKISNKSIRKLSLEQLRAILEVMEK